MMQGKVIILTGNKRAGKTTLANKLNKEYNFTHINMDQILDAVDYVCDEKNIPHFIDCYSFLEKLVDFACQNAKNYGENTVIEYIFKISDVKKIQEKYDVYAYALYTDTDEENLREVQVFPPNVSGVDLLMGGPNTLTETQLRELHIKIRD